MSMDTLHMHLAALIFLETDKSLYISRSKLTKFTGLLVKHHPKSHDIGIILSEPIKNMVDVYFVFRD